MTRLSIGAFNSPFTRLPYALLLSLKRLNFLFIEPPELCTFEGIIILRFSGTYVKIAKIYLLYSVG